MASFYESEGLFEQALVEGQKPSLWDSLAPNEASKLRKGLASGGAKGYWQEYLALTMERSKRERVQPTFVAQIYVYLGDKDQAFKWLNEGCDDKNNWVRFTKVDPGLDVLRKDPRFERIVRRIGLPN